MKYIPASSSTNVLCYLNLDFIAYNYSSDIFCHLKCSGAIFLVTFSVKITRSMFLKGNKKNAFCFKQEHKNIFLHILSSNVALFSIFLQALKVKVSERIFRYFKSRSFLSYTFYFPSPYNVEKILF